MSAITYRKTQQGEWVAFGPAAAIQAGATVTVTKRSGETKTEHIARVGKPFTVNGAQMVYGYIGQAPKTAAASHTERCDRCRRGPGRRAGVATHVAYDASGEEILLCADCARLY